MAGVRVLLVLFVVGAGLSLTAQTPDRIGRIAQFHSGAEVLRSRPTKKQWMEVLEKTLGLGPSVFGDNEVYATGERVAVFPRRAFIDLLHVYAAWPEADAESDRVILAGVRRAQVPVPESLESLRGRLDGMKPPAYSGGAIGIGGGESSWFTPIVELRLKGAPEWKALAKKLARTKRRQRGPLLLKFLDHPDPAVREDAVTRSGKIRAVPKGPILKKALDDEDADVVIAASWLAVKLRLAEVLPQARRLAQSPNPRIADPNCELLCKLKDVESAELIGRLAADPKAPAHSDALLAVRHVLGSKAAPILAARVREGSDWLRLCAATELVACDPLAAAPALRSLLGRYATRDRGIILLGLVSDRASAEEIARSLDDVDDDLRAAAARALARVAPDLLIRSSPLFRHDAWVMRAEVLYALNTLRHPEAFDAVDQRRLQEQSYGEDLSTAAAALSAETGVKIVLPEGLTASLKDYDPPEEDQTLGRWLRGALRHVDHALRIRSKTEVSAVPLKAARREWSAWLEKRAATRR